ncbi:hypothetical protein BC834DRAFT_646333 [Gloeopeniophorella convolvens]|nr:hypothetical protein BC834DRAFT_646333 [Gloeopeniophorella convolvens]
MNQRMNVRVYRWAADGYGGGRKGEQRGKTPVRVRVLHVVVLRVLARLPLVRGAMHIAIPIACAATAEAVYLLCVCTRGCHIRGLSLREPAVHVTRCTPVRAASGDASLSPDHDISIPCRVSRAARRTPSRGNRARQAGGASSPEPSFSEELLEMAAWDVRTNYCARYQGDISA